MTKRFTHKRWYNAHQLFDGGTPFAIVDVYLQGENICNKLNELHEENKSLKRRLMIMEDKVKGLMK